jgi:hypothetical protein
MYRTPLFSKATLLISVRLLGSVILFKLGVVAKANSEILVRVEPGAKITDESNGVSQKAPYLISVTLAGIVMLVIVVP